MKYILIFIFTLLLKTAFTQYQYIASPNEKLTVEIWSENNRAYYSVSINNQPILIRSKLGLVCEDEGYTSLSLVSVSAESFITDSYESPNPHARFEDSAIRGSGDSSIGIRGLGIRGLGIRGSGMRGLAIQDQ